MYLCVSLFILVLMPTIIPAVATSLQPGQKAIIDYFIHEDMASKLLDIGVKPGALLELVRRSPFGGSWYVKIDRQRLALRKQELACIVIK